MNYQFDPFIYTYEEIDWPVYDFKTECILAAKKAEQMNKTGKPIIIMMSGGIDSEIIGESFFLANIPFKVLIGKLQIKVATQTITLNQHDFCYAEKWCRDRNIEIEYCCMDVYKDAETLTKYAMSSMGFSPQYAWHMYLMKWCSDHGYFFIAGLGDIDFVLHDGEYYCEDTQREWSIDNFCKLNNIDGLIRFVKIDSRLTAAFLKLESVKRLMNNKVPVLLDYKYEYFSEVFPTLVERPKLTGFERIQEWDSILRGYMKQFHSQYNTISKIPAKKFIDSND